MELDVFISETLKSLIKGVKDSQQFAHDNGARVNPHLIRSDYGKVPTVFYGNEDGLRALSSIDFDIAVSTSKENDAGGKAGINVLSLNLGGHASEKAVNETVSRIKFSLNVALPNVKP